MNIKTIFVLLKKDIKVGIKNFIVVWVLILPLVLSLVVSLLIGTFFVSLPKLGVYAEGETEFTRLIKERRSVKVKEYSSLASLESSVKDGVVDVGIVIPEYFDEKIKSGEKVKLTSYIFGESYARNRAIIVVTVGEVLRVISENKIDMNVITEMIGGESFPLSTRIFPLIVIMAIFLGGLFIPAVSLIEERSRKTLDAVKVSSANTKEIIFSKWLFGFLVSLFSGILILGINNVLQVSSGEIVFLVVLGAIMATLLGLIAGMYLNDMTSLFALWKSAGIIIFFPAITYLFPQIPEIISKFFPTYYVVKPIMDISTKGKMTNPIFYFSILIIINLLLYFLTLTSIKRRENLI